VTKSLNWHSAMNSEVLYNRSVIGERLRIFAFTTLAMDARDVQEILEWLDSDEFHQTCRKADLNADKVTAKFHDLISQGNATNVQFALN
jgi:hypothetical protein